MNTLLKQAQNLFTNCSFPYYICGGFALELYAEDSWRAHSDLDISTFYDYKEEIVEFLLENDWKVYKKIPAEVGYQAKLIADSKDKNLENGRVLWALKDDYTPQPQPVENSENTYQFFFETTTNQTALNFIEVVFDELDVDSFVLNKEKSITRTLDKAILFKENLPYLAPEIVLFLKSNEVYMNHEFHTKKTPIDFNKMIPLLTDAQLEWLRDSLEKNYPDGFDWLGEWFQRGE